MTYHLNRDALNAVDVGEVANATMAVIDRIQNMSAETAVAAMAATFLLMCERYDLTPQDAFAVVDNVMNYAEGRRPEFKAVAQYLDEEL